MAVCMAYNIFATPLIANHITDRIKRAPLMEQAERGDLACSRLLSEGVALHHYKSPNLQHHILMVHRLGGRGNRKKNPLKPVFCVGIPKIQPTRSFPALLGVQERDMMQQLSCH